MALARLWDHWFQTASSGSADVSTGVQAASCGSCAGSGVIVPGMPAARRSSVVSSTSALTFLAFGSGLSTLTVLALRPLAVPLPPCLVLKTASQDGQNSHGRLRAFHAGPKVVV